MAGPITATGGRIPQSLEAERAVLGAMILEGERISEVIELIPKQARVRFHIGVAPRPRRGRPEVSEPLFSSAVNQEVFEVIVSLQEREHKWAAVELEAAANVEPTYETVILLARCYSEWNSQSGKAADRFLHAFELGEDAEGRYLHATALKTMNRDQDALAELNRAVALQMDDVLESQWKATLELWRSGAS